MIFSDFYKSPRSPLSKLRTHHPRPPADPPLTATPEWVSDEYADLLSRDKTKQKDAVRRYLSDKVRDDWIFAWPPAVSEEQPVPAMCPESITADVAPSDSAGAMLDETKKLAFLEQEQGSELDESESDGDHGHVHGDDDAESVYSVVLEDAAHYRFRTEWDSDLSDVDHDEVSTRCSPCRFDDASAVKPMMQDRMEAKKARRRRAVREEMTWNDGLACFEARRNAWTGARTVRLHRNEPAAATPPASPPSPRRLFFRRSMSGSPPGPAGPTLDMMLSHGDSTAAISDASSVSKGSIKDLNNDPSTASSSASSASRGRQHPVETLLPSGQPILPPDNPLRASISPEVYLSIYNKVILHNLQPACPVNLSDMLRSCVAGWKRDGEWPPRPSAPEPIVAARKKKKKATTTTATTTTTSLTNEQAGNVARRMSFGLLGRDGVDESAGGKGIRRSLQRALGIGAVSGVDG